MIDIVYIYDNQISEGVPEVGFVSKGCKLRLKEESLVRIMYGLI